VKQEHIERVLVDIEVHRCEGRTARVEALETLLAEARKVEAQEERDTALSELLIVNTGKSPCGHWSAHAMTNDGGKTIFCLECQVTTLKNTLKKVCDFAESEEDFGMEAAERFGYKWALHDLQSIIGEKK
jgi:hypothetical protein